MQKSFYIVRLLAFATEAPSKLNKDLFYNVKSSENVRKK